MKNLVFIVILFSVFFGFSQGGPKVDAVKFRGKITSTIRDTFDVPTGETWLIHNITTNQFEWAGDDDVWSNFSGTGDEWGDSVDADIIPDATGTRRLGTEGIAFSLLSTEQTLFLDSLDARDWRLIPNGDDMTLQEYTGGIWVVRYRFRSLGFANSSDNVPTVGTLGDAPAITASGFSGNLTTSDNTLQELADAVDGLSLGGGTDDQTAAEVPFTPNGSIAATDVQAAIQEVRDEAGGSESTTVSDTAEIDLTLTGSDIEADIVSGSIDETKLDTSTNASLDLADSALQSGDNISDLTNDSGFITAQTDDQTASEVAFTPYSTIASTNVQAAIQEVLDEASGSGVTASSTDTFTNKTIVADNNTISNIGSDEIANGGVATIDIANDAITSDKIADNSVGASQLGTNSVGPTQLKTGNLATDGYIVQYSSTGDLYNHIDPSTIDDQAAADVAVTDSGGYYAGTDVEAVLQEVGSDYASITSSTAGVNKTVDFTLADSDIDNGILNIITNDSIVVTVDSGLTSTGFVKMIVEGTGFVAVEQGTITTLNGDYKSQSGDGETLTLRVKSATVGSVLDPSQLLAYSPAAPSSGGFPTGWDLDGTVFVANPASQAGGDGTAVTTVTDEHGTVTFTTQNVTVNVAASTDKEFDFAATDAWILAPSQTETEFSVGDSYSIAWVQGETLGGDGGTLWAKNDKAIGTAENALYTSAGVGAHYMEGYGYGESVPLGSDLTEGDLLVMVADQNGAFNRFRYYVNGTLLHTVEDDSGGAERTAGWYFGAQLNGAGYSDLFTGTCQGFALFNDILTPAEQVTMTTDF